MKRITFGDKYLEEMRKAMLDQMLKEFSPEAIAKQIDDSLKKVRMADGSFTFNKNFKFERKFSDIKLDKRAKLTITSDAFAKLLLVLMSQDKEVGWHGVTERVSETEFVLKDILIYPQKVTAATVDTDDAEYAKWLISIGEENFNNLHFHGHSHVNMAVTPSSTDMGHREDITAQLGPDDYYIFMIWNKRLQWTAAIYDMASNVQFETDDIDVIINFNDGSTAGSLLKELSDKVKPYTYQVPKGTTYPSYEYGGTASKTYPSSTGKKTENKSWWEEQREKEKGERAAGNGREDFRGGYGYGYQYPYYDY